MAITFVSFMLSLALLKIEPKNEYILASHQCERSHPNCVVVVIIELPWLPV